MPDIAPVAPPAAHPPAELTPTALVALWKKEGGLDSLRRELLADFLASPDRDALLSRLDVLLPSVLSSTPAIARQAKKDRPALAMQEVVERKDAMKEWVDKLEVRLRGSDKREGKRVERELRRTLRRARGREEGESEEEAEEKEGEVKKEELTRQGEVVPAPPQAEPPAAATLTPAAPPAASPPSTAEPLPIPVPPSVDPPAACSAPSVDVNLPDASVAAPIAPAEKTKGETTAQAKVENEDIDMKNAPPGEQVKEEVKLE
ncbi:hypothetical protein JCM8547_009282 [Rhodosporidiobolus lusitaniae]